MAKPQEKTASVVRPIAPPPFSQHLRELASRPHAWAVIARNLIPVVGIYGFGWSTGLAVFNYWFDGLTALAAIVGALLLARWILTAIDRLHASSARLAAGDLTSRAP